MHLHPSSNNGQHPKKSKSAEIRQWLIENKLPHLIDQFVLNGVTLQYLFQMNTDELRSYFPLQPYAKYIMFFVHSEFLSNFDFSATDKILLRSKLHHKRLSNKYTPNQLDTRRQSMMTPSTLKHPQMERPKSNKSADAAKYTAFNQDNEIILSKLTQHQNSIQTLMNDCLHSSNLLNENFQISQAEIDNEFNQIIKAINRHKQKMFDKLNEVKLQKLEQITQSTVWLNERRQITSNTMAHCMQLMSSPNSTHKIRSIVNDLLNNQRLPNRMDVNADINLSFDYKSNIDDFLSSICSFGQDHTHDLDNENVPHVDDLSVSQIKCKSAIIKFHSSGVVEAPGSSEGKLGNGFYFDLSIFDVDDMKHNESVLKKRFDYQKNNAIYKMDLIGLRSNNRYKVQLNVMNKRDKCLSKMCKEFKTAKDSKTRQHTSHKTAQKRLLKFNVSKIGKQDRFLIKDNGKTVVLNEYDSGSCLYGSYLQCDDNTIVSSVCMKLSNICSSGFGLGFATKDFVDFDGWNTGQNGSVMIYGNSEFYTSEEFMVDNEKYNNKNGAKLFKQDFMKRNDVMMISINNKLKKLEIMNQTTKNRVELNMNDEMKSVAIILWMGWTHGQNVTIAKETHH